jgi:hypothetical protein
VGGAQFLFAQRLTQQPQGQVRQVSLFGLGKVLELVVNILGHILQQ